MLRRVLVTGCLLLLLAGAATAGDMKKKNEAHAGMDGDGKMAMMMKEMMNCDVCKHMVPHMNELGPVMTNDIIMLNDGVAMMHGVSDPAMLKTYREVSAEMGEAGEACMALNDKDAKTHLCEMCQDIRSAVHAGARLSMGDTKTGDVMVLTSEDPAVQKQLSELGTKCEMMMSSM